MQLPFSGQAHAALAHVNEELSSTLIQLFIQRVDPLIRLIHLPSFFSQLQSYKASLQSSTTQYPTNVPENYFSAADSTAYTAQNPSASLQRQSKSGFQAFETLLCSVYFAAITTVVADPNPPYFGKDVDIDTLSAMFKREVTIQLALLDDVDLARNGTLEMLQAIVLMLVSSTPCYAPVRLVLTTEQAVQPSCSHPRTQWIRLGSATRMAQAMGLHRDPAQYGLRPIETETRRRLWAQICMLDVQFAEELGCEPTVMIGSYDTCLPLSISDDELTQLEMRSQSSGRDPSERSTSSQPNLTEPHQNYSPYSPMTFSLIPFEASRVTGKLFLSRYQPKDSIVGKGASISRSNSRRMRDFSFTNCSLADKSFLVDLLEERFHQVYKVQSFDPADPFQSFVARSAELHVAKARFVIELLRWKETVRTMDTVERERETKRYGLLLTPFLAELMCHRLFQEAVSIATKSIKMIYDPRLSEWLWYMKQFREVYTCSFVLFNLACGRSLDPADVQAAWQTIDQLFPPAADNSGSTHRSPLGRLLALARSRRGQQHTGAWQETAPPQVSSAPISQHPPLVHPYPTRMQPTTSEAYIPAQAALSGTMFEDMDFMMQNPYWPENMNTGQFPNDSLDPWV